MRASVQGNFILRKGPKQGMGHGMEAMDQFIDRYWPEEVDALPDPLADPVVDPVPVEAADPGPGPGAAPGAPAGAHDIVPDPPADPLAAPAPDGVTWEVTGIVGKRQWGGNATTGRRTYYTVQRATGEVRMYTA